MANFVVLDGNGSLKELSASGTGTTSDPFVLTRREEKNTPQQALIYKSLTLNGAEPVDITNRNMAVDGSATPQRFLIKPPAGQTWQLTRMIFLIRDGGAFDVGGWGNNGGVPLTNGMTVGMNLDGVEYNFTPVPWTSHADLAGVAYDVTQASWGAGDDYLTMRLTFAKAGQNIRLIGDNNDYLWMDVNDNLGYLVEQRCMVQGFIEGVYL